MQQLSGVTDPVTVGRTPHPTRVRRMRGPAAVMLSAAAVGWLVREVDPSQPGHYPLCPFRALTGWDCPGCGTVRALHAVANGDVAAGLDHNLMTVLALPVLVGVWFAWTRRQLLGLPRAVVLDSRLVTGLAVVFVLFAVVRNLPGVPFLGSGVG